MLNECNKQLFFQEWQTVKPTTQALLSGCCSRKGRKKLTWLVKIFFPMQIVNENVALLKHRCHKIILVTAVFFVEMYVSSKSGISWHIIGERHFVVFNTF